MSRRNKSRVFITGASGFIGANLTRKLLKNNFDIHILTSTKNTPWRFREIAGQITIYHGDLTNFNSLKKTLLKVQPIYIIHLATYGAYSFQTEIDKMISVNIIGTKNLLEASKNIPYKYFINTGSSSEYGFKNKPMKEDDFCNPISYYAATKLSATNICKVFARLSNKPIVTFRLFSVYGPFEEPTRFIPAIIKSLITQNVIRLTPGNQRRDFVYIDDVVDAYMYALSLGKKIQGEIFNIGTGTEYTNDEVVKTLFASIENKTKIEKGTYPKRMWDTPHWVADISKSQKMLNWKPKHSLKDGLKKTYSWFKNKYEK